MPRDRPALSVIVPFHGSRDAAEAAVASLAALSTAPGDEVIFVDNTRAGVAAGLDRGHVRIVHAPEQQSSYHARNAGIAQAGGDWLLFVDADCRPEPGLLDAYFAEPVPDDAGALAGAVAGAQEQTTLVARWSHSRRLLDQDDHMDAKPWPFANTSNLLVRRTALEAVGRFQEGIRSGGDVDLSWRLQRAGWQLLARPGARVEHLHRDTVKGLARQMVRYAAGNAWLARRYPGSFRPRVPLRTSGRAMLGVVALTLTGRWQRARFRALDVVRHGALETGWVFGNGAMASVEPPTAADGLRIAVLVDRFPVLSETFVVEEARALKRLGHQVRVEARERPERPNPEGWAGLTPSFAEDAGLWDRVRDLRWLVTRHPLRALRDLLGRRRWAAQEAWVPPLRVLAPVARRLHGAGTGHLHAHFAAGSALDALRLSRLLGIPWSVTAHAYDIYQQPRNLELKLSEAWFSTSGCAYTVRDLRAVVPGREDDVHEIVMGVDAARFRRRGPHPGGRRAIAVGRLVEKKGFAYLVEALAATGGEAVEELVLVGEGPLEDELRDLAQRLGVSDRITFAGAMAPAGIRDLLEEADVLVMPCVVAADGDRDSMPVVVKEALAMELPVVCSDEVGLPELVRDEWGRLVPPADPPALARALGEMLGLDASEREAMGRRGREFVSGFASTDREAQKLAGLIREASGRRRP